VESVRRDTFVFDLHEQRSAKTQKDLFWEARQMIEEWNRSMTEKFIASWKSCLDGSMMKWMNKFTCPGFMFAPRKPWPFGNELHTIACCSSGMIFALEMVEDKDQPTQLVHEFAEKNKTVSLLL
jgi:hypothetical protein